MRNLVKNDCRGCIHKRTVPGNTHILCVRPDEDMTGDAYGINQGWFIYPDLFDPIWMTKECCNFEARIKEIPSPIEIAPVVFEEEEQHHLILERLEAAHIALRANYEILQTDHVALRMRYIGCCRILADVSVHVHGKDLMEDIEYALEDFLKHEKGFSLKRILHSIELVVEE